MRVTTLDERTLVVGAAPVGLAHACGHGGRFAAGGWWMASGIVLLLVVYPFIEVVLGPRRTPIRFRKERPTTSSFTFTPSACWWWWPPCCGVSFDGLTVMSFLGMISAGLNNGASGIVAAHELGHRKPKIKLLVAGSSLLVFGHLRFTSPPSTTTRIIVIGPATRPHLFTVGPKRLLPRAANGARTGEGALAARPVDTKRVFLLEGAFLPDWRFIAFPLAAGFVVQAIAAVYLLEFVNYLQHHGLRRHDDERPNATHAWESRHRLSRWTLMELPLHPSHHLKSSTRYERLDVHDESPQFPSATT